MRATPLLLTLGLSLLLAAPAWAKVSGPCSNCHTMHNSQDGSPVNVDGDNNNLGTFRSLTKGDCIGCHTGSNGDGKNIPYVMSSGEPTYPDATLAGGNFYWVKNAATSPHQKGHNVAEIAVEDNNLSYTPPGYVDAGVGIQSSWDSTNQLSCAGTNGCHGQHTAQDDFKDIRGAHHGDDSTLDPTSGDISKHYRFLKGIDGIEDDDWEYTSSNTDHNVYNGVDRGSIVDITSVTGIDTYTISYFCATCHGDYHSKTGGIVSNSDTINDSDPWLRHPSDYDMSHTTGEYQYYNSTKTNASPSYSVEAPIARDLENIGKSNYPSSDVFQQTGDAIVTCISCHRAHGSPNDDLLRWDYAGTEVDAAGTTSAGTGCFVCHTSKDGDA